MLWDTSRVGSPIQMRCETGHAYSADTLAEAQTEDVERALWAALRALEDKAELARVRGSLARERGLESHVLQFDVQLTPAADASADGRNQDSASGASADASTR